MAELPFPDIDISWDDGGFPALVFIVSAAIGFVGLAFNALAAHSGDFAFPWSPLGCALGIVLFIWENR